MKREDIDKKIGMPDVDAEWAKFEREVINLKTASRKTLYWSIGIAASIALVAGIFLFGNGDDKQGQIVAQQFPAPVGEGAGVGSVTIPTPRSEKLQTPPPTPPLEGRGVATQNNAKTELMAQTASSAATEEKVFDCGEVMPQFPGGNKALMEFLKTNLKYPDLVMEYGAKGRVITTFVVDSIGQLSNFKVMRYMRMSYDTLRLAQETEDRQQQIKEQIAQQLGEESIRILSMMPRWTPGSQFGRLVNVKYALPIAFNVTDAERETYLAQKQAADDDLQDRIAGLTIVPSSTDLGPGNVMRLGGIRIAGSDSVRIGRKTDFDFLVVIDGQPLSEAEQKRMLSSGIHIYFFNRQQIINSINIYKDEDAKRPYVEQYGERAKNAVMAITTAPDTLCDAYVQQHPELMQTRHRIEGYVIDKDTNEPLPDTWINCTWTTYKNVGDTWIKHTDGAGAATDSTGHFVLWPPRKDVKLQASRTGYVPVRIDQPADTTLTIRMTNATVIKGVKVVPKSSIIRIRGNE